MDDRKKILLANKDILSRKVQDFYLDINLSKDNKEVLPQKYDNVFDVSKFYEQERDECRSFIIYGIVDSYSWDCNNVTIKAYQSSDLSLSNYLCQTKSIDIVNNHMPFKNIYNKLRGRYIIDNIPTTFTGCSVYLKVEVPGSAPFVIPQQLIFTTLTLSDSGEKIVEKLPFGLNEAVTTCDGDVIEVNNDFDFFYNKHWIKKDIQIQDYRTKWIGNPDDVSCTKDISGHNTGMMEYNSIIEVYAANNAPTGNKLPNTGTSYISAVESLGLCPLPIKTELRTKINPSDVSGSIIVNPDNPDRLYFVDDDVHITAIESNTGFTFNSFKNEITGNLIPGNANDNKSIDVLMDTFKSISANFDPIPLELTVQVEINLETIDVSGTHHTTTYNTLPSFSNPNYLAIINGVKITGDTELTYLYGQPITIAPIIPHFLSSGVTYNKNQAKLNGIFLPPSYSFAITDNSVLTLTYTGIQISSE